MKSRQRIDHTNQPQTKRQVRCSAQAAKGGHCRTAQQQPRTVAMQRATEQADERQEELGHGGGGRRAKMCALQGNAADCIRCAGRSAPLMRDYTISVQQQIIWGSKLFSVVSRAEVLRQAEQPYVSGVSSQSSIGKTQGNAWRSKAFLAVCKMHYRSIVLTAGPLMPPPFQAPAALATL